MATQSKPRSRLTAKQEAFAVNYFTMRNATQAAIKAGYSPHLIDTHSYHLLENASIKARLQELHAEFVPDAEVAKAVVRERLEILSEIARHPIEMPVSAGQKISAIAEMSKLGGDYPPEKHAILGKVIFEVVHVEKRKDYLEEFSEGKE